MTTGVPLPEPVACRTRYRSEPGMIGHYPWTYSDKQRKWTIRATLEHETLHSADQMRAHAAAVSAADNRKLREALQAIVAVFDDVHFEHADERAAVSGARAALKEKP